MMIKQQELLPFTPLVIIGAGRSGTNALRNALTCLPDFATWPCDEINPIWRHGNHDWPNDEIPPERATLAVRQSIRSAFQRIWHQKGRPRFIVEKTCANSLRVPFVDAVLPEARYINIVRNGLDTIASAKKRWRGELEVPGISYYFAKARYSPLSDLPRYAVSALRNRVAIKLGRQEHFDFWGPRFDGLEVSSGAPLDEIVARQWAACVNASDTAFAQIDSSRVLNLRYEDFTNDPARHLTSVTSWLNAPSDEEAMAAAASSVHATSVGKGQAIAEVISGPVKSAITAPMRRHGYWEQE